MKHIFGGGASRKSAANSINSKIVEEPKKEESVSKRRGCPVDLDELYDNGYLSDTSICDITETTVSYDVETQTPDTQQQRMSALTRTMAEKQEGISDAFCSMIHSMAKLADASEKENSNKKEKTSSQRSKKIKEMEEQAAAMANKQARIAQQFESLVYRLEQESLEKEATNQQLTRQLKMARMMLKDEAGIEMEEVSTVSALRKLPPRTPPSRRPPRATSSRNPRSLQRSMPSLPSVQSEIFSIKEISFSNAVVDIGDLMHLEDSNLSERTKEEHAVAPFVAGDNVNLSEDTTEEEPTTFAGDNVRLIL